VQIPPATLHKGGFILHNSLKSDNHSAECRLVDQLIGANKAVSCPNDSGSVN
jgi:hypothetical protein